MIGRATTNRFPEQLPPNPMPEWLFLVNENTHFDINCVLLDSVYYPGSWIDFIPIDAYSKFAHSFVYVDYGVSKTEVFDEMHSIVGYTPIFLKDISQYQLSPRESHRITPTMNDCASPPRMSSPAENTNASVAAHIKSYAQIDIPFCIWGVYERNASTSAGGWRSSNFSHSGERISLLFVGGEGVATYQALYNSNNIHPVAIVLKAADARGFGGNWTDFEKRGGILERVVMANPVGIPKYLFTGNNYDGRELYRSNMYWEEYTRLLRNKGYLNCWTSWETD